MRLVFSSLLHNIQCLNKVQTIVLLSYKNNVFFYENFQLKASIKSTKISSKKIENYDMVNDV